MVKRPKLEPAEKKAFEQAEELKRLVFERTGLKGNQLACPREHSDMTPCVARDGKLAATIDSFEHAICVGCEIRIHRMLKKEEDYRDPHKTSK